MLNPGLRGFDICDVSSKLIYTNQAMNHPLALIFMGVAGSGKTTIAKLFAEKTGAVFYEGDDFHPPSNVAKMRQGVPLTDDDRAQWLGKLREMITRSLEKG